MPLLWSRILLLGKQERTQVRQYWQSLLNECKIDAKLELQRIGIDSSEQKLEKFLHLRYAPYIFNSGRYDYILPDPGESPQTIDDALEYIQEHHKLYDPAMAIMVGFYLVIGGWVPCGCANEFCIRHRIEYLNAHTK
jgi:hypothetical protein